MERADAQTLFARGLNRLKGFPWSLPPTIPPWNFFAGALLAARLSDFEKYSGILAIAIAIGSTPSHAATNNFNLSGNVADAITFNHTAGPNYRLYQWQDPLYTMPSYSAREGDRINATITLDHSYTIPATVPGSILYFGLYLYGDGNPQIQVDTSTTISFFNQGAPVLTPGSPRAESGTGALYAGIYIAPPDNPAITFDQVSLQSDITYLGGPDGTTLDVHVANLIYALYIPIPEPCCFALIGIGLAGLGLAKWRRRLHKATD